MVFRDKKSDLDILQLLDMAHVPEVKTLLQSELKRIKGGGFKRHIDEYWEQKKKWMEELFNSPRQTVEITAGKVPGNLYWFELTEYSYGDWRMTNIQPEPPLYSQPYEVLPRDIIEKLADSLVNPEEAAAMDRVRSDLMDKDVDLRFVHYSSNFIMGTVRDSELRPQNFDGLKKDKELAYRVFYNYFQKYPDSCIEFIREFLLSG
jgi:hypothetical protein